MPNLKDELLAILTRTKTELYPAIHKSVKLNASAKEAEQLICKAFDYLQQAQDEIQARCNDNIEI